MPTYILQGDMPLLIDGRRVEPQGRVELSAEQAAGLGERRVRPLAPEPKTIEPEAPAAPVADKAEIRDAAPETVAAETVAAEGGSKGKKLAAKK